MKIIDLLNKIANGNIPKRIIYNEYVYQWNNIIKNYEREVDTDTTLNWDYIAIECLNEEVEIIEDTPKEDKKIKKIDNSEARDKIFTYDTTGSNLYFLSLYVQHNIVGKINEIIDKVNGE